MVKPNFNSPNVHVQSWYVVDRATARRPGQARSFDLLGMKQRTILAESQIHPAFAARRPSE